MRLAILLALAACGAPPEHKLPGASITPHLRGRPASPACGYDITYAGARHPAIIYTHRYDIAGRLIHSEGAYNDGGPDDTIDYQYDNLGHTMHMLETRGVGETRIEVTSNYDTLGDLLEYTWQSTTAADDQLERYLYTDFTPSGRPTREVISSRGQPDVHLRLDYDAMDRIAQTVRDDGSTTIYTYDADRHTVTIDTDHGAFRDVFTYDERGRELSEVSDGSDPSVIASATIYAWGGDQLLIAYLKSGSAEAPHDLETYEVDTYLYDCRIPR